MQVIVPSLIFKIVKHEGSSYSHHFKRTQDRIETQEEEKEE